MGQEKDSRMVLTEMQLKGLAQHKYSVINDSLIDPHLQKFWIWVTDNLIPLWWAPNSITLTGLIFNMLAVCVMVFYSPDLKQQVPGWTLLLGILGLFVYQTLDAVDGKQARRTNTSSPLGELFDHGCDALTVGFQILGVAVAVQMGFYPGICVVGILVALFYFYCSHWQTYVTGTMRFTKFDATECQIIAMACYLMSAIFGTVFWSTELPYIGVEPKKLVAIGTIITISYSMYVVAATIGPYVRGTVKGHGVHGREALLPAIPIATVMLLGIGTYVMSTQNVCQEHPGVYMVFYTVVAAKITHKLVIAHMTKTRMPLVDRILIGPAAFLLNQYFNAGTANTSSCGYV